MKRVLFTIFAVFLLFGIGCASVDHVATFGSHEIHTITTRDWIAPATTTVLAFDTRDEGLHQLQAATGASGLSQIAGPAAVATGAYFIGKGLKDSGDNVNSFDNSNTQAGSASGSIAKGGNAAAGAISGSQSAAASGAVSSSVGGPSLF